MWNAVFENKNDWNGWKSDKYTPVTTGYVSKDTFELGKRVCYGSWDFRSLLLNPDCKKLCEAHDKCNSCQGTSIFCIRLNFILRNPITISVLA